MRENRGPEARIADAAGELARIAGRLPEFVANLEAAAGTLARGGVRLDSKALDALARRQNGSRGWLVWAAIALLALALFFRH